MINPDSVSSVNLSLYRFGGYGDYGGDAKYDMSSTYSLHNILSEWSENWDKDQAQWYWDGDENVTYGDALDEIEYESKTIGWFTYDVTESIKSMLKKETDNKGFVLICKVKGTIQQSGNQTGFYSSEYEEIELRPKLEIAYRGDAVNASIKKSFKNLNVIKHNEICNVKIMDVSGRLIQEFKNVRYKSINELLRSIKSNKMVVMNIRSKKGIHLNQKVKTGF